LTALSPARRLLVSLACSPLSPPQGRQPARPRQPRRVFPAQTRATHAPYCVTPPLASRPLLRHAPYCVTPPIASRPLLRHAPYCVTPPIKGHLPVSSVKCRPTLCRRPRCTRARANWNAESLVHETSSASGSASTSSTRSARSAGRQRVDPSAWRDGPGPLRTTAENRRAEVERGSANTPPRPHGAEEPARVPEEVCAAELARVRRVASGATYGSMGGAPCGGVGGAPVAA
jgi:hypothetical protein